MKGAGEIEHRSGCASVDRFNRGIQALRHGAERGDGIRVLTADQQKTALRQTAKVNDVVFVQLDDFSASAAPGALANLVRGSERGMGKHEDGDGRWFATHGCN